MKWVTDAGIDLEPLPRTEPRARWGLVAERVRGGFTRVGMGRCAAAGGPAVVARADRVRIPFAADLAEFRALAAAGGVVAQPGRLEGQWRWQQRDPHARRRGVRAPVAAALRVAGAAVRARRAARRPVVGRQRARLDRRACPRRQ